MWSLDKLREKLEAISNHPANFETVHDENLSEAGVLVPILVRNGVPSILLTVRSMNLSSYPGQVAFPGGKRDPGDKSLVATALRETQEEIGLSKDSLNVLGSLLNYVSSGKFLVKPVVAEVVDFENYHPKINPFEVSELLIVPLEIFINQEHHKCKCFTNHGMDVYLDFFEFSQNESVHVIWGITALISTSVASLLFDRLPAFEYHEQNFKGTKNYYTKQIHESFIKSRL